MSDEAKRLRISHSYPVSLGTAFANHCTAQQSPRGEFYISFFEIVPPMLLGEPDEIKAQVDKLEEVEARCVARIVVTKDHLVEIVGAFAEILSKHEKSKKDLKTVTSEPIGEKHAG